jgi:hypothetical protein
VTDQQGRPVVDAVLVAVPVDRQHARARAPARGSIDQVDKEFLPRVTIVPVGASVTFPNRDDAASVYSFSPAKRFELAVRRRPRSRSFSTSRGGGSGVTSTTGWWAALRLRTALFAKTGKDGKAVLTELPVRAYVVRVWHPNSRRARRRRKRPSMSRATSNRGCVTVKLKRKCACVGRRLQIAEELSTEAPGLRRAGENFDLRPGGLSALWDGSCSDFAYPLGIAGVESRARAVGSARRSRCRRGIAPDASLRHATNTTGLMYDLR